MLPKERTRSPTTRTPQADTELADFAERCARRRAVVTQAGNPSQRRPSSGRQPAPGRSPSRLPRRHLETCPPSRAPPDDAADHSHSRLLTVPQLCLHHSAMDARRRKAGAPLPRIPGPVSEMHRETDKRPDQRADRAGETASKRVSEEDVAVLEETAQQLEDSLDLRRRLEKKYGL